MNQRDQRKRTYRSENYRTGNYRSDGYRPDINPEHRLPSEYYMDDSEYAQREYELRRIREESRHPTERHRHTQKKRRRSGLKTAVAAFVLMAAAFVGVTALLNSWNKVSTQDNTGSLDISTSQSDEVTQTESVLLSEVTDSDDTQENTEALTASETDSLNEADNSNEADYTEAPSDEGGASREDVTGEEAEVSEKTVTGDPDKAGTIFAEEYENLSFDEKIELLRQFFPRGKYWNHYGTDISGMSRYQIAMCTSDRACENFVDCDYDNWYTGVTGNFFCYEGENTQCLGFAGMISDFLYGEDAGIEVAYDFDEIEVGDHIRLIQYEHSITVIEKGYDYIKVVECNQNYEDCLIEWDRTITRDELLTYVYEIIKRCDTPYDEQTHTFTVYGPWMGSYNISYSYDEYYGNDDFDDHKHWH